MIRRPLPLLLQALVIVFFGSASLQAKAQAKLAIYGTIGGERSAVVNDWTESGTIGLYHDLNGHGPLSLAIDARGELSGNVNAVVFGPRLALHLPAFPIKPYGELLVGGMKYANSRSGSKDSGDLAYRWVAGVDSTILPRVDWRVIDFSYGGGLVNLSTSTHMKTLSTGLVLRF